MSDDSAASFREAAETPDRDDEPECPEVDCADCGAHLGSHPFGTYADCEGCGGFTLSRWLPPREGPSDDEIARGHAAWAEAIAREHAEAEAERIKQAAINYLRAEAAIIRAEAKVEGESEIALQSPKPLSGPDLAAARQALAEATTAFRKARVEILDALGIRAALEAEIAESFNMYGLKYALRYATGGEE